MKTIDDLIKNAYDEVYTLEWLHEICGYSKKEYEFYIDETGDFESPYDYLDKYMPAIIYIWDNTLSIKAIYDFLDYYCENPVAGDLEVWKLAVDDLHVTADVGAEAFAAAIVVT